MNNFIFNDYFENIAIKNKQIAHDPNNKRFAFHRASSYVNMEEMLSRAASISGFQLVILDNEDGQFINNTDRVLDKPVYTFWILKNAKSDMSDRAEVIDECKTLMKQVLSKMFLDSKRGGHLNSDVGLRYIENVKYWTVGPIASFHGLEISFSLYQPPHIIFNQNDWYE